MTTDSSASNGNDGAVSDSAPVLPDYAMSPNAIFTDEGVEWRYGRAPDYTNTRKVWAETKRMNHATGSLEEIVENLVKNWEVEASFKPRLSDWRTIDHDNYSFAMNGGIPQSAEHMIKVGTYNGIIGANEYYSPNNSDFDSSHKTFKRMMPTFAWEVLEVYSGPPKVAFRWRHWGQMKNNYVGFNDKGEKVTAKAHGGFINIEGVTIANVDDKLRLQGVQTFMDPLEMFRQIAPNGIVNKSTMNRRIARDAALDDTEVSVEDHSIATTDGASTSNSSCNMKPVSTDSQADDGTSADAQRDATSVEPVSTASVDANKQPSQGRGYHSVESNGLQSTAQDTIDQHLERPSKEVHPHPKTMEDQVAPTAGEAIVAATGSQETRLTHEEMGRISDAECPFLMNRE